MRNIGLDYHPKFYGVALFKLLPEGKKLLISKRMLWNLFNFSGKIKPKTALANLVDDYNVSAIKKDNIHNPYLASYFNEIKELFKLHSEHTEMYYELEYFKALLTQLDTQENMQILLVPDGSGDNLFIPQDENWLIFWENPNKIFTQSFPVGLIFSFLFDKITVEEFINKFEQEYKASLLEKNNKKLIFTDLNKLLSMIDCIKNFNPKQEQIKKLQTQIALLYGQMKNFHSNRKDFFKPLFSVTPQSSSWNVVTPQIDIWYNAHHYLTFFSLSNLYMLPSYNITRVLANYRELTLEINFMNAIELRKNLYEIEDCIKEYLYQTDIENNSESVVALSFNLSAADFINNQVYMVKNGKKIYGQEISSADLTDCIILPQNTYKLGVKETRFAKNVYLPLSRYAGNKDPYKFSTFYFKFPLDSKDYDDTDFVVEGLSFNGEPLPPLKVHLNYVEAEEPYEKTTIKEVPPDYFYEHGLALYKTDSEGEKELITKKLFHNYAKYIGKATETVSGFREYFNYYKPITIEITKNNHSVLNALLKETEILAKKHIEHAEFSEEISELYSFLMLANSLESCFIYDSPDPYNDKLFLPNKIDASYIFDICPLEKLIDQFLKKEIIKYYPEVQMTTELFAKEYKNQYILQKTELSNLYNLQDCKVISEVYSWINLYPKNCHEEQLRTEIGKLFGLFSKIHYVKDDYAKPAVQLTQTGTDWEFFTPFTDRWNYRFNRMLLPTYFFNRGAEALPAYHFYWYFATIDIEQNKKLAVMIQFNDLPEKRKVVYDGPNVYEEYEYIKEGSTYHETAVTLSFTNQEVDFDNSKVYFLVNGEKKMGKEVNTVFLQEENCTELGEHIYTLNSHEVLLNNKVCLKLDEEYISPEAKNNPEIEYEPYRETGPFVFSSYFFKFPITCEEYENAEFVLDGLSYKGQALPPLRVKLNYVKDYELS